MAKSLGYYTFIGSQNLVSGNSLPITATVRQYGNDIHRSDNAVVIGSCCDKSAGYYTVSVNATVTGTATGTGTVTMYLNGVAVPGATQSTSFPTTNLTVPFTFTAPVRIFLGQNQSVISFVYTGANATVSNVAVEVVRE